MSALLKVDNIMYKVKDLEKSKLFYSQALGLKQVWEDVERHMVGFKMQDSDAEVVIHANPDMPPFDYNYLVQDVVAICDTFKAQGFSVLLEPIDVRCGKYAMVADPDGNKIPIIDLTAFGGIPKYDN